VANYFKGYGWITGMPTHYPVRFATEKLDLDALLGADILPTFTVASFQAKGALLEGRRWNTRAAGADRVAERRDPPTYVAAPRTST
jgi:membrane-bound lytic murein transglycosylase B